jgi:transposase
MWLARLTQRGMLRPSFVPSAAIRAVRDFTRARTDLVRERTRCLQRLEKLLEDAMVKITSAVADGMKAKSAVAMVAALIAGERDPRRISDLAKGPLRGKRDALAEALDGNSGRAWRAAACSRATSAPARSTVAPSRSSITSDTMTPR